MPPFLSSPDPEADEDGELTYENVQVPPGPGGPSSLASAGLGDKAGLESPGDVCLWGTVSCAGESTAFLGGQYPWRKAGDSQEENEHQLWELRKNKAPRG